MKNQLVLALFTLLLVTTSASATAQVVARQGSLPQPDVVKFNSPMILELPVPALAKLQPGSAVEVPKDIRKYICDNDVSFATLQVGKRIQSRREGLLQVVVSGFLTVRASYDRSAGPFHILEIASHQRQAMYAGSGGEKTIDNRQRIWNVEPAPVVGNDFVDGENPVGV